MRNASKPLLNSLLKRARIPIQQGPWEELAHHYRHISAPELLDKVAAFRALPTKSLTYEEVASAIRDVFLVDVGPKMRKGLLIPTTWIYSAGSRFYRVRKLEPGENALDIAKRALRSEQDAWNAPASVCRQGRLNKEGESILYTSAAPNTAIEETRLAHGDNILMSVYVARKDIRCADIGGRSDFQGLDELTVVKYTILRDFLYDIFARDCERGLEHYYVVSEIIAKEYFDWPPEYQDAWRYPSVADPERESNIAFRPAVGKEKLTLEGVLIGTVQRANIGPVGLRLPAFAQPTRQGFQFVSFDSIEARDRFPEFTRHE